MTKWYAVIAILIFSSSAFSQANPMLGKWSSEKGDCSSFVTEYTQDSFYFITTDYLIFTKRKKVSGIITYKVNLPLVEFNWVQPAVGDLGMKSVTQYIYRVENPNTMREIFHRYLIYWNNELTKDEWKKEDGTSKYRLKLDGEWNNFNTRLGLKTLYRCQ